MNSLRRFRTAALAATLAPVFLVGCNDSSPTEPKLVVVPTPTPQPTPVAAQGTWSLTSTVTAASGSFCIFLPSVGQSFHTTFTIQRNGDLVTFVMPDPIDWEQYTVAQSGLSFASAPLVADSGMGMCARYRQTEGLTGAFSADGNQVTASESWSFALDSGETVTRTFSWSASRIR